MKRNIYVTQPSLPELKQFQEALKDIWQSKNLTNNGPNVKLLEEELSEYLGAEHLVLFANGTLAIMRILFSLEQKGEIITSPFTFAATSNSIELCGSKAVFSDIDENTLNLSPALLQQRINKNTTAIMPVACYGNTAGLLEVRSICDRNNLLMIADCAHCFGVRDTFNPLSLADYSVLSFHAQNSY